MDELTEAEQITEPARFQADGSPSITAEALAEHAPSLAEELGRAYRSMLRYQADAFMDEMANGAGTLRRADLGRAATIDTTPSEHIGWPSLADVAERDPDKAADVWERIRDDARDELTTGHRAARALEWQGRPWDRARFLAIRSMLIEEWQPRGGIELALLDQMAIAHSQFLEWSERLFVQAASEARTLSRDVKFDSSGSWDPPTVEAAAAIDQAGAMAERWQRLFVRAARALRDLRRFGPAVVVNGAAQVNVAAVQQNVTR